MRQAFVQAFGAQGTITIAQAPGRVNLIGEHTDYNEGFVLPMTIDQVARVALRPRADRRVEALSLDLGGQASMHIGAKGRFPRGWGRYVGGVFHELSARGLLDRGADVLVRGNVPLGGGLSSSAALCAAVVSAAGAAFDFDLSPLDAALLCRDVEHRHAGVRCGIMDPLVVLSGRRGCALLIDCRSNATRHIVLPDADLRIVIVDSGVRRALTTSGYNERRVECETAVVRLATNDLNLRSLRDVTLDRLDEDAAGLTAVERRRVRHVVTENARVLDAVDCLERSDSAGLGTAMTASHQSLRDDFEVSHPALDRLVDAAIELEGVLGARMTGAGFGGCTVQLVQRGAYDEFTATIQATLDELGNGGAVIPIDRQQETGLASDD